jgi:hypothetical protein
MIGPQHIHPDELGDAQGLEMHDALRASSALSEAMEDLPTSIREDFVDGVMAALADEPTPGTAGFLVPLRRRGIRGLGESLRQAWSSVGGGRPIPGRSAALAYVLVVAIAGASLGGALTLGAAGALGLLGPAPTDSPEPSTPDPSLPPPSVAPVTQPPSPSPNTDLPTAAPTPSPTETDDEPEGSDDNGGNSGPGGGDDGDDDSSGSGEDSGPGSSGNDDSGSDDSGGDDSGSDDAGGRESEG